MTAAATEIVTFARLHARPGEEDAIADALHRVHSGSIAEPGCLDHRAYRSIRDPRLFYVWSRWRDEAAFELHATLPHTVEFLFLVEPRIDHDLEVVRTTRLV